MTLTASQTPATQHGNRIVELVGVTKVYRTDEIETRALNEVSLTIDRGEFVSIEGPSGSGKSTLLSIIGLLDAASSGSLRIAGEEVVAGARARRSMLRNRHIGFVFQSFNLIGDLSVEENVALPLAYAAVGPAERRKRARAALERVGMASRARHRPAQLSGGQQQRVAVARAVVTSPDLLLADEPTGNLDSESGESVMSLLRELHEAGTTVCMVTHNVDYARRATRVVHMADGRISEAAARASVMLA